MKILMVLTSHGKMGNTGKKTGLWLEEFAAPYYFFNDNNAQITLASPEGGQPPVDPNSTVDDAQTEATVLFGSTGGCPPSGDARVSCALLSLKN